MIVAIFLPSLLSTFPLLIMPSYFPPINLSFFVYVSSSLLVHLPLPPLPPPSPSSSHLSFYLSITPVGSCPDLGSDVENGNVEYSKPLLEHGRYLEYTTATVSCSEGYTGGGVITCQTSGNWSSPTLPSCESESNNYTLTT